MSSELQTRSSVGTTITDSEDVAIASIYAAIKRMPQSLFNRKLTLAREYEVHIRKIT